MEKDLYKILSVEPTASQHEINEAVQRFSNIRNASKVKNSIHNEKHSNILASIRKASTVLTDPIQRLEYDIQLGYRKNFDSQTSEKSDKNKRAPIRLKESFSIEALKTIKIPGEFDAEEIEKSIQAMEKVSSMKKQYEFEDLLHSDAGISNYQARHSIDGVAARETFENLESIKQPEKGKSADYPPGYQHLPEFRKQRFSLQSSRFQTNTDDISSMQNKLKLRSLKESQLKKKGKLRKFSGDSSIESQIQKSADENSGLNSLKKMVSIGKSSESQNLGELTSFKQKSDNNVVLKKRVSVSKSEYEKKESKQNKESTVVADESKTNVVDDRYINSQILASSGNLPPKMSNLKENRKLSYRREDSDSQRNLLDGSNEGKLSQADRKGQLSGEIFDEQLRRKKYEFQTHKTEAMQKSLSKKYSSKIKNKRNSSAIVTDDIPMSSENSKGQYIIESLSDNRKLKDDIQSLKNGYSMIQKSKATEEQINEPVHSKEIFDGQEVNTLGDENESEANGNLSDHIKEKSLNELKPVYSENGFPPCSEVSSAYNTNDKSSDIADATKKLSKMRRFSFEESGQYMNLKDEPLDKCEKIPANKSSLSEKKLATDGAHQKHEDILFKTSKLSEENQTKKEQKNSTILKDQNDTDKSSDLKQELVINKRRSMFDPVIHKPVYQETRSISLPFFGKRTLLTTKSYNESTENFDDSQFETKLERREQPSAKIFDEPQKEHGFQPHKSESMQKSLNKMYSSRINNKRDSSKIVKDDTPISSDNSSVQNITKGLSDYGELEDDMHSLTKDYSTVQKPKATEVQINESVPSTKISDGQIINKFKDENELKASGHLSEDMNEKSPNEPNEIKPVGFENGFTGGSDASSSYIADCKLSDAADAAKKQSKIKRFSIEEAQLIYLKDETFDEDEKIPVNKHSFSEKKLATDEAQPKQEDILLKISNLPEENQTKKEQKSSAVLKDENDTDKAFNLKYEKVINKRRSMFDPIIHKPVYQKPRSVSLPFSDERTLLLSKIRNKGTEKVDESEFEIKEQSSSKILDEPLREKEHEFKIHKSDAMQKSLSVKDSSRINNKRKPPKIAIDDIFKSSANSNGQYIIESLSDYVEFKDDIYTPTKDYSTLQKPKVTEEQINEPVPSKETFDGQITNKFQDENESKSSSNLIDEIKGKSLDKSNEIKPVGFLNGFTGGSEASTEYIADYKPSAAIDARRLSTVRRFSLEPAQLMHLKDEPLDEYEKILENKHSLSKKKLAKDEQQQKHADKLLKTSNISGESQTEKEQKLSAAFKDQNDTDKSFDLKHELVINKRRSMFDPVIQKHEYQKPRSMSLPFSEEKRTLLLTKSSDEGTKNVDDSKFETESRIFRRRTTSSLDRSEIIRPETYEADIPIEKVILTDSFELPITKSKQSDPLEHSKKIPEYEKLSSDRTSFQVTPELIQSEVRKLDTPVEQQILNDSMEILKNKNDINDSDSGKFAIISDDKKSSSRRLSFRDNAQVVLSSEMENQVGIIKLKKISADSSELLKTRKHVKDIETLDDSDIIPDYKKLSKTSVRDETEIMPSGQEDATSTEDSIPDDSPKLLKLKKHEKVSGSFDKSETIPDYKQLSVRRPSFQEKSEIKPSEMDKDDMGLRKNISDDSTELVGDKKYEKDLDFSDDSEISPACRKSSSRRTSSQEKSEITPPEIKKDNISTKKITPGDFHELLKNKSIENDSDIFDQSQIIEYPKKHSIRRTSFREKPEAIPSKREETDIAIEKKIPDDSLEIAKVKHHNENLEFFDKSEIIPDYKKMPSRRTSFCEKVEIIAPETEDDIPIAKNISDDSTEIPKAEQQDKYLDSYDESEIVPDYEKVLSQRPSLRERAEVIPLVLEKDDDTPAVEKIPDDSLEVLQTKNLQTSSDNFDQAQLIDDRKEFSDRRSSFPDKTEIILSATEKIAVPIDKRISKDSVEFTKVKKYDNFSVFSEKSELIPDEKKLLFRRASFPEKAVLRSEIRKTDMLLEKSISYDPGVLLKAKKRGEKEDSDSLSKPESMPVYKRISSRRTSFPEKADEIPTEISDIQIEKKISDDFAELIKSKSKEAEFIPKQHTAEKPREQKADTKDEEESLKIAQLQESKTKQKQTSSVALSDEDINEKGFGLIPVDSYELIKRRRRQSTFEPITREYIYQRPRAMSLPVFDKVTFLIAKGSHEDIGASDEPIAKKFSSSRTKFSKDPETIQSKSKEFHKAKGERSDIDTDAVEPSMKSSSSKVLAEIKSMMNFICQSISMTNSKCSCNKDIEFSTKHDIDCSKIMPDYIGEEIVRKEKAPDPNQLELIPDESEDHERFRKSYEKTTPRKTGSDSRSQTSIADESITTDTKKFIDLHKSGESKEKQEIEDEKPIYKEDIKEIKPDTVKIELIPEKSEDHEVVKKSDEKMAHIKTVSDSRSQISIAPEIITTDTKKFISEESKEKHAIEDEKQVPKEEKIYKTEKEIKVLRWRPAKSVILPTASETAYYSGSIRLKSVAATTRIGSVDIKTIYHFGPGSEYIEIFIDGELRAKIVKDEVHDVYCNTMKHNDLPPESDICASTVIEANGCVMKTDVARKGNRETIAVYKNDTLLCRAGNTMLE